MRQKPQKMCSFDSQEVEKMSRFYVIVVVEIKKLYVLKTRRDEELLEEQQYQNPSTNRRWYYTG